MTANELIKHIRKWLGDAEAQGIEGDYLGQAGNSFEGKAYALLSHALKMLKG